MNIFISWSGKKSQEIASILHSWLPYVIQAVKPFISSEDIDKGDRWSNVLTEELKDIEVGIICITHDNINAPWLNFEAGALSKSIGHSSVYPFLFLIDPSKLKGPLSQFQSTICKKEDIRSLLFSINRKLKSGDQLGQELLDETFEHWWPQLALKLDDIMDDVEPKTDYPEPKTDYPWLYKSDEILLRSSDLRRIKARTECRSIWVITPSPYSDLKDIIEVIQGNIRRGVRYSFLFPRTDCLETTTCLLRDLFSPYPTQLIIKEISYQEFLDLVTTQYLILNPNEGEPYYQRVFIKLPIKQADYWIEVDKESGAAFYYINRFRKLMGGDNLYVDSEGTPYRDQMLCPD